MSKDNLKDQSSLISSWTSTSSREPLVQYSDTRQGLVGSLRHPIRGLRFSCRSPWICPKVQSGEKLDHRSNSEEWIKGCAPLPWPARPWPCSSVRTYLERVAPSIEPSHPSQKSQDGSLTRALISVLYVRWYWSLRAIETCVTIRKSLMSRRDIYDWRRSERN